MTQNTHLSEPTMKTDRVSTSSRHKSPPGPRENWLLGSASNIQRDPLGFNMSMFQRYGNVVAIRFLIWPTYMIFTHKMSSMYSRRTIATTAKIPISIASSDLCLAGDCSPTTDSPGCTSGDSCNRLSIASNLLPLAD